MMIHNVWKRIALIALCTSFMWTTQSIPHQADTKQPVERDGMYRTEQKISPIQKETGPRIDHSSVASELLGTSAADEAPSSGSLEIWDKLLKDEASEAEQLKVAEIWQAYLEDYQATHRTPERRALEQQQQAIMLAKDKGEAVEEAIPQLAPLYPEDYAGSYLGKDRYTIVLSSFDNLARYQALFEDPSQVAFELVDHGYVELFDVCQQLMETYPGTLANVSGITGRITLEVPEALRDEVVEDLSSIEDGSDMAAYRDVIDIEDLEYVELAASGI